MAGTAPIQGTCRAMCSAYECGERQNRQNIHSLEATAETAMLPPSQRCIDPERAVKQHARTAEGRAEAADQVRPIEWLRITVTYLLGELQLRAFMEGHQLYNVYTFTSDRLMAVRKDLIMQALRGPVAIGMYEEIIRYLILMGYLLGDKAPPDFDAHLNMGAIRSGLTTLLSLYQEAVESGREASCLTNRDEFLSYQVLLHSLDTVRSTPVGAVYQGLDSVLALLPREVRRAPSSFPLTHLSVQAVSAVAMGNHVRLLRLFAPSPTPTPTPPSAHDLPSPPAPASSADGPSPPAPEGHRHGAHRTTVLQRCLTYAMLPVVRRRALELFTKALFFKDWTAMVEVARLLCFRDQSQARDYCLLHSVPLKDSDGEGDGGAQAPSTAANFHKKVVLTDPDVKSRERLQEVTGIEGCRNDVWVLGACHRDVDWTLLHRHIVPRAS